MGTALHQHTVDGYTGVTENVAAWKLELALFKMFDELPWTTLLSSVAMMLTIIFFVTSSDSGSLIIDIIAAGGKVDAPVPQRVFWCSLEGVGCHRAATWRRSEVVAGGIARNRLPVRFCSVGNGGVRLDGASQRIARIVVAISATKL